MLSLFLFYIVVSLRFIFSIIRTLYYPDFLLRSRRVRIIEVRLYHLSHDLTNNTIGLPFAGKICLGSDTDSFSPSRDVRLRTAQNIFLPKNINAVTNCIENSTVSRGIWDKYRLVIYQISPKWPRPHYES